MHVTCCFAMLSCCSLALLPPLLAHSAGLSCLPPACRHRGTPPEKLGQQLLRRAARIRMRNASRRTEEGYYPSPPGYPMSHKLAIEFDAIERSVSYEMELVHNSRTQKEASAPAGHG